MYGSKVLRGAVAGTAARTRSVHVTPAFELRWKCVTQRWPAPLPVTCWYSSPSTPALLTASAAFVALETTRRSPGPDHVRPRFVDRRTCRVRKLPVDCAPQTRNTLLLLFGSTAIEIEPPIRCCPVVGVPLRIKGKL